MRKKIEDCCRYQEQIRKLKKKKRKVKIAPNFHDECDDDDDIPVIVKKKMTTSLRKPEAVDTIAGRIKPSVGIRDEYSLSRHAKCVMADSTDVLFRAHFDTDVIGSSKGQQVEAGFVKERKKIGEKITKQYEMDVGQSTESSSEADEICSFDSDIDLSGLTLTPSDRAKIANLNAKSQPIPSTQISDQAPGTKS